MISTALLRCLSDTVISCKRQRSFLQNNLRSCRVQRNPSTLEWSGISLTRRTQVRNKDLFITQAFLTQLFSKRSNVVQTSDAEESEDISEFDKLETEDEIVLLETTRSDGSIASLIYRNGGLIDAVAANELCIKVNWPSRPLEKLATALENSYLVSSVHLRIDGDDMTDRLIAMGRATSDHAFNATIWDIIVDPEYQGKGIGKCLVERMVRTLLRREITNISIFADKQVVKFYQKLGFEADPDGIKGMFWYPSGFAL
eukprot:g433.t1